MVEEEYPSVPKKDVGLGKGVVILPPERLVSPKKEIQAQKEEKPVEKKQEAAIQQKEKQISNLLLLVVGILAVISLAASILTMLSIASLKAELKAIASDLKEFKKSTIELNTQFDQPHSIQSTMQLNRVIDSITIPVPPQEIQSKGSINVVIPAYGFPANIPWEGKITVFGSITINGSSIPDTEKMKINYTIPSSGDIRIRVSASDIFRGKLDSIIERLEKLSE